MCVLSYSSRKWRVISEIHRLEDETHELQHPLCETIANLVWGKTEKADEGRNFLYSFVESIKAAFPDYYANTGSVSNRVSTEETLWLE